MVVLFVWELLYHNSELRAFVSMLLAAGRLAICGVHCRQKCQKKKGVAF